MRNIHSGEQLVSEKISWIDTPERRGLFNKIMSNKLNRKQLFRLVPARPFFTDYAPMVTRYYQKLHGKNGRGEPLDFSADDIKLIKKGLKQLAADIKAADV